MVTTCFPEWNPTMLLLANFALFQVAWLSSVIGGAQDMPWLGPVAVLVALAVHLHFARKPLEEIVLVLLCALIGAGFDSVAQKGTEHRDEMTPEGFVGNNAGGILGGISSGQDVVVSTAFKPTSSLRIPCRGLDVDGNEVEIVTKGRHDPCVGIRATPIVEAMMALVLMDHVLLHRAQIG